MLGSFLPWLRSGHATRNSYQTDGAIDRLLELDAAPHLALRLWPFVSLACAAAIVLLVFGLLRIAAVVTLLCSVVAGAVAAGALVAPRVASIAVAQLGPSVTLAGSVLGGLTAIIRFATPVRPARSNP